MARCNMNARTAVFSCFVILTLFPATPSAAEEPKKAETTPTVTVIVDYGDGVQKHFTALAWKEGQTVLDALRSAEAHPRGIQLEVSGTGAKAFLMKIDNLENEGRGRNWIYRVNGKKADSGMGVRQLAAGDSVLWSFEKYR
jgi:hypothetical protein